MRLYDTERKTKTMKNLRTSKLLKNVILATLITPNTNIRIQFKTQCVCFGCGFPSPFRLFSVKLANIQCNVPLLLCEKLHFLCLGNIVNIKNCSHFYYFTQFFICSYRINFG